MATLPVPPVRSVRPLILAASCFGVAVVALAVSSGDQPLSATTNPTRIDFDRDGISDEQELVLGTSPYRADSDRDTYSDLEEHARATDPLDPDSLPGSDEYGVGMCANQDGDMLNVLTSVFVDESRIGSLSFEVGIVIRGQAWRFAPTNFRNCRGFLRGANHRGDRLAGIEVAIPASTVRRRGQLSMFSIMRDTAPGGSDPVVSMLNLVDFSGVIMAIEPVPIGINNFTGGQPSQGVQYRPLAGDSQIPITWSNGEMCMQSTAAVGMAGVNIIHEVQSAGCVSMDTFCSPGDCSASVGQPLALPDPAALAGG